jgi:hypothetical protein
MQRTLRPRPAAAPNNNNVSVEGSDKLSPPRRQGRVRLDDLAAIRTCDNVKDDIIDLLTVMQNRFEHERYLTKLEKEVKRIQKKIHALDAQVNKAFENITSVRAKPLRGVSAEVI